MLTESEHRGAKKLFRLMSDDEVMSLARTVTKVQVDLSSTEEAVNAILAFSETGAELLRRRKMKRDILFKYLYNEGISVAPVADKFAIIQRVLQHWGSEATTDDYLMESEDDDSFTIENPMRNKSSDSNSQQLINTQILQSWQSNNAWRDDTLRGTDEDQEMALQFSKWFYQMLNACNPIYLSSVTPTEQFGPLHFFSDATLALLCMDRDGCQLQNVSNSEEVCKLLVSLVVEQHLLLNPNLEPSGVKGLSNPHGMRVIIVCGTVHRQSDVLGPFEQQFGLVRDPFSDNNWKIKFTRLALSSSVRLTGVPTLEYTSKLLST